MRYVNRSAWGARYGRGPTNITPGGVTVHYEGGGKLTGRPHSGCAARVRGIEDYHVNTNGWAGIAYTLLVCEHGYVFEGRGLGHRTAANGTTSGNQNWYAVCALIGDLDPLSDALLNGMRDAIDYLDRNGAGSRINGHRDHLSTSCPGSALYAWVKKGAPRPGTAPGTEDHVALTKDDIEKVADRVIARLLEPGTLNRLEDAVTSGGVNSSGLSLGKFAQDTTREMGEVRASLDEIKALLTKGVQS